MIRSLLLSILLPLVVTAQKPATAKKVSLLMGCRFEITAVAESEAQAWEAVEVGVAEIQRIERLISSWDENSQTSMVNRAAGIRPVKVHKELFDLIYRAKKVSALTDGAFDISFASMGRIWKFDGTEQALPDSSEVGEAKSLVNYENILLDLNDSTVLLKNKGMRIGFGGIGKGYAANKAKELMANMPGVVGGVVNASGDLTAWGSNGKNENWPIQIADPKNKERAMAWLGLQNMAIVTSGDYEKYFMSSGTRYAHIVNPKTGYPTTGIKSVSVICPDAELADALATSIFVMGKEEGLKLINALNKIECIIVTDDNKMVTSANLKLNYY